MREWATALIQYLVVIRPFAEYLVEKVFPEDNPMNDRYRYYLWPGVGSTMTSVDLREKLGTVTERYLGKRYGIKFWRSLTTIILQYMADEDVSNVNQQYYYDTANMHSTQTANAKYGGNTGNMLGADSRVIAGCVRVGLAWHKRIGVGQSRPLRCSISEAASLSTEENKVSSQPMSDTLVQQIKAFHDESIASISASVTESMAEMSRLYFPPPPRPHTALHRVSNIEVHPSRLTDFRTFIGDPNAQWTCPEQAVFVEHLVLGKENVLGILGTGFGKTTILMFVAKTYGLGRCTLVVMPLASLHEDFHDRARQYRLKADRWRSSGSERHGFANPRG
jgi:hypothetical protein